MTRNYPKRWITLAILLFSISWVNGGYATTLDQLLSNVEKASRHIRSLQHRFTQVRQLAAISRVVTFTGIITFSHPDQMRMDFQKPIPSVLILNGTKGLRCNQGMPQPFDLGQDPELKTFARQITHLMSGQIARLHDQYHMQVLSSGRRLIMTPTSDKSSSIIRQIQIDFNDRTWFPEQIEIHQARKEITRYTFNDFKVNPKISSRLFRDCTVP